MSPGSIRQASGSSPLARGLRHNDHVSGAQLTDHPHSRGVYGSGTFDHQEHIGSSPLARGLQGWDTWNAGGAGIIPARAGFTRLLALRPRPFRDHPRSRGVYLAEQVTCGDDLGSSPLARGLRREFYERVVDAGIIPARAGFTGPPRAGGGSGRDHPRSRGVYHSLADGRLCGGGIIPARAGFTVSRKDG